MGEKRKQEREGQQREIIHGIIRAIGEKRKKSRQLKSIFQSLFHVEIFPFLFESKYLASGLRESKTSVPREVTKDDGRPLQRTKKRTEKTT